DALLAQIAPEVVPFAGAGAAAAASRRRRIKRALALAAAVAACALALPAIYGRFRAEVFSTQIGEQRTIQLSDASILALNADSRIRVQLGDTERDIELLHGEALFQVARDTHRPFKVQTRTALVQAIGTQFNIYDMPDGTRVSVLEGRVRVQTARETR